MPKTKYISKAKNTMKPIKSKHKLQLFISIGAGLNQIPLIEEAKRIGFQVIGVDKNSNAEGFVRCDIAIKESIEDYRAVYRRLRELHINGDIRGVLSRSYGPAIKTACFIANKLKIPMIPFKRIDDFIYKDRMKKVLQNIRIDSPDYHRIDKTNLNRISEAFYPFVIKPLMGHAKRDVKLISNKADLKSFLSLYEGNYLIEKYIEGDEIIALGITHQRKYHLIAITDKIKISPPYFVDIMHIFPSKYFHLMDKIIDWGQRVTDGFGIITSPLVMEIIVDRKEKMHLIEAVPEFGGEYLPDILIPTATGYNFFREAINAASNSAFTSPPKNNIKNAVVVKFITGECGTLASFNPTNHDETEEIIFSRIFKNIGSEIKRAVTNHDRIGAVISRSEKREDAIIAAERGVESLNVRIIQG
jgi:biotin carboxylase